jgi:hypothetical protein
MNHLDVGFTNNIASVLSLYFHVHFPNAIATAAAVNKKGEPPVFKYTSHAWLLDIFLSCPRYLGLNCPPNGSSAMSPWWPPGGVGSTPNDDAACVVCPNASLVAAVEQAIRADVITWHAFPFNPNYEKADAGLLLGGIDSVHALDARFNKANKTVISQRDVPGVTRGIIPLMAKRGLVAFSDGINAATIGASVPTIFNWSDAASGTSIIGLFHARGYGRRRAQVEEEGQQEDNEDGPGLLGKCTSVWGDGLSHGGAVSLTDVVEVGGFKEALVYAFKADNSGPPNVAHVAHVLACIRNASGVGLFPGSSPQIIGSSFDAFLAALLAHPTAASSLPVVTSEIGDTWIYGCQSDPKMMKLLRLMMRERSACSDCDFSEAALMNFTRMLLKPTEHTWGLHGAGEGDIWDNARLQATLAAPVSAAGANFHKQVESWVEQRLFTDYAVAALTDAPHVSPAGKALGARIRSEIATQWPVSAPVLTGFVQVPPEAPITTQHFTAVVSATTGGLSSLAPNSLLAAADGVQDWASATDHYDLFKFVYRSFTQAADFKSFRAEMVGSDWHTFPGSWFGSEPGGYYDKLNSDHSTCNATMGCSKSQDWLPTNITVWHKHTSDEEDLVAIHLIMPHEAHMLYGAPEAVYVTLNFTTEVTADVRWIGKTTTRLPEATLFMLPLSHCSGGSTVGPGPGGNWSIDKLGSWIEAADVVAGGGAGHLHAVGDGGARRSCGEKTVHGTMARYATNTLYCKNLIAAC